MKFSDMNQEQAVQWLAQFGVSEETAKFIHSQGLIPSPEEFPPSISDHEIEIVYTNLVGMPADQVAVMISITRYGGTGDVFVED